MFRANLSYSPLKDEFIKTQTPKKTSLSFYYYNDTHGNSDQMSEVIHSAQNFKLQNKDTTSFIVSAGDNCAGANPKKNKFIFDLMQNAMGVDISTLGNHEMDAGAKDFYESAKDKKITFIATNVTFDDDTKVNDVVKKSIIKEKNGEKFGFIGTMPIDFEMCTKQSSQKGVKVMSFDDTVKALQDEINKLKKQGINKIILLSHIGYDADKKLASMLEGVDIVIGGHTHS
ncbi:metallophosphoesterase, partial [bacterium]|nr:metallophosphoesterase [bacterium]